MDLLMGQASEPWQSIGKQFGFKSAMTTITEATLATLLSTALTRR